MLIHITMRQSFSKKMKSSSFFIKNVGLAYMLMKKLKGTCYIETPFGRVDASVDTQLMQLKDKLLTALEAGAAE